MAELFRIYFDTNEGDEDGRYDLGIPGSLRDITPISGKLSQGLKVTIYMTDELEMEASLEFDSERSHWKARPIPGTIRYLDV